MSSPFRLAANRYGKARVRLARVSRGADGVHQIRELTVQALAEGDFEAAHLQSDNAHILPTDTIKNSVYGLASQREIGAREDFGEALGRHYLSRSPHMSSVTACLWEGVWQRLLVDGQPHPHAFQQGPPFRWFAEVAVPRSGPARVVSGVEGLSVLKTTASAFSGYLKDAWTTLPETRDRFFGTLVSSRWEWHRAPADYAAANQAIVDAMLRIFATEFSESVQATLYSMGCAALAAVPEIERIHFALPNRHYLHYDVARLGLEDKFEVFLPTDEPHGQIEATVERNPAA
ncbi:MAG: urate oxidase [Verrucomicrobia bacterium]|nr:urate oxidase [Verrucomicrobiota bacterium]